MRTTTALLLFIVTFGLVGVAQSPKTPRSRAAGQFAQETVVLTVRGMT